MNTEIIRLRNKLYRAIYQGIFKPFFFTQDPEFIHDQITSFGAFLGKHRFTKWLVRALLCYKDKRLEQNILGINFKNPVGLAAGFDKDAQLTNIIPSVGFGFMEIGSITGEPCQGNPKPRLWRLPKSKSTIVWYGLKNNGAETISQRLKKLKFDIPIGTSIAKTNSAQTIETSAGINDYKKAFSYFTDIGDYFAVNISCPNAYGGEPLCESAKLESLLNELDKIPTKKPVFLKISPDLELSEIDKIIETAKKHRVHGFIISNLPKDKKFMRVDEEEFKKNYPGKGGVSGKAVEEISNKLIAYVYQKTKGKFIIIGCGGIFSAEDAYKKIKLGASLVQLITGMIFEGPQVISEINRGLSELLKRDDYTSIRDAIGVDVGV